MPVFFFFIPKAGKLVLGVRVARGKKVFFSNPGNARMLNVLKSWNKLGRI